MADVVALPRPDTDEMVRVHVVFREAFALAPQLIGAVANDDVDQVSRIATYYEALLLFLHVHHEGEDEILWPRLLERCPSDSAVINLAADHHNPALTYLTNAQPRLPACRCHRRTSPDPDRPTPVPTLR